MTETATRHDAGLPADLRLRALHDAILSPAVLAVSTDVFDTLVWRQVPEPVDAFPLIADRLRVRHMLAESISSGGFGQLRRIAERHARAARQHSVGQSEVRLGEIYERIPAWVFNHGNHDEGVQAELEVESEILVPDLDVVALLTLARDSGKTLVAISDTYFSQVQLRRLFAQPVLGDLLFDRIFTSSDHRTNKSGGLFEIALRALGIQAAEMVHLGDNHEADIHYPGELGIGTFYFERRPEPFATVSDAELAFMPAFVESVPEAGKVSGLTATRSKALSRAHVAEVPDALRPYWDYGATVLGPVFTGFAEWVHEHCARTGARKVGCLMREGAFLGDLLRRASPYLDAELEAVPLWLNRDICLRASISSGSAGELERVLLRRSQLTVGGLCSMLGLALPTIPAWVSHADTSLADPVVRHNLIAELSSDEQLRAAIIGRSRALRSRIVDYVDSLWADAPDDVTIVDLGWGASIQSLLAQLLASAGRPRHIVGLYLLTHEGAAEQVVQGIEAHGFLGEYGLPDAAVKTIMRAPELLEQICMPPHGTQLDLREDFGPEVAPGNLPSLQLVEAEVVRKGVLAYQREWARYQTVLPGKVGRLSRARHLLRPILLRSVAAPTQQEVVAFGGWHHDEGQGSDRTDPIVPADTSRLRYMNPDQLRALPMSELYWPYAAATLVDEHWGSMIRLAAAGQIDWQAFGAPLETGRFTIHGTGVDVAESSAITAVPVRNRFGLSSVTGTIRAPFVQEIHIRPAERPVIVRMDWIQLRLHVQGDVDPIEIRFDAGGGLVRWRSGGMFHLAPGLYVSHDGTGRLALDLAAITPRVVFCVDVECAFATLPISSVLPVMGRFSNLEQAESALATVESSLSWRATAPLRKAKRRFS